MVIPTQVEEEWMQDGRWAMLQPETVVISQTGVMVGKTRVDLQGEQVPVHLLNLSDKLRKIKKGTLLATCEPVLAVLQSSCEDNLAQANVSGLGPLPTHLKELFERTASNLMPCQKDVLHMLLHDYAVMFLGPKDLGRTDLAKYQIDTGDAPPLR